MKNIHKIYYLVFLTLLASCHKQLNVFPTTSEVDGNVIVDLQGAKTALNGVYYLLADAGFDYNNKPSIMWCDLNEIYPSELSGTMDYSFGGSDLFEHTYDATSLSVSALWTYNYKIVNAANGFLKNISSVASIDAGTKNEMIAEAKFLRAYANATLLFYFGQYDDQTSPYGIILRKDFVTTGNISLPRSSVKESYDFILADLDDAIAGLSNLNSQIYYANVWAAKLLQARVLMERGASGDYGNVIDLCNDIITNGPFALEDSTKDVFLSKGLNSSEVIFGVQPYPDDVYKYNEYLFYMQGIASDSLLSRLQNDPRMGWMTRTIYLEDIPAYALPGLTKYYPGPAPDPNPTAISNVSYPMRLTEAYLLKAEAIATSGGSLADAKDLLKTVLQHAGFTDFSDVDAQNSADGLKTMIIKEDMKNFVGEAGQDWLAVRRLPFSDVQQLIPTLTNKTQLLLPIPKDEMTRNLALSGMQNPGY